METRLQRRIAEQQHKRRMWAITAVLLIFAVLGGAFYYWLSDGLSKKRLGGLVASKEKVNILVLGVDERAVDGGRSDTMFLLTIDTRTKKVEMLSIPRDTRVKIPGHGWDKINHAYAYGKTKLAVRTVEELLGIPLDYYVAINFSNFCKIVDIVGGVDINVEKRMYYSDPYDDNGGLVINLRPGLQHMDGKTAIQYVRYRDEEGDLGRIQRQQKFIKAVMDQVTRPGVITRIPTIISEIGAAADTDMSINDMLRLADLLNDARNQGLVADMVPGKPSYIDDISYWLPDIVALRGHVAEIEAGVLEGRDLAEAEQLSGEYERSIPREMKIVEVPQIAKSVQDEEEKKPDSDQQDSLKPDELEPGTQKPDAQKADTKKLDAKKPDAQKTDTKKPDTKQPTKPPVPDRLSVTVYNASGNPNAGLKVAAAFKNRGFEVAGVTNSSQAVNNTVVVSYSSSDAVLDKLTGLPFKYILQITKDNTQTSQVVVYVGKDYN